MEISRKARFFLCFCCVFVVVFRKGQKDNLVFQNLFFLNRLGPFQTHSVFVILSMALEIVT